MESLFLYTQPIKTGSPTGNKLPAILFLEPSLRQGFQPLLFRRVRAFSQPRTFSAEIRQKMNFQLANPRPGRDILASQIGP
jgi:hypothetical protein